VNNYPSLWGVRLDVVLFHAERCTGTVILLREAHWKMFTDQEFLKKAGKRGRLTARSWRHGHRNRQSIAGDRCETETNFGSINYFNRLSWKFEFRGESV